MSDLVTRVIDWQIICNRNSAFYKLFQSDTDACVLILVQLISIQYFSANFNQKG